MKIESVGSFLPPESLIAARAAFDSGAMPKAMVTETENRVVSDIVERQLEAGLVEVTSGEIRRRSWDNDFYFNLGGIQPERIESGHLYQPIGTFADHLRFTGRISHNPQHPFFNDFVFLHEITAERARCRQTLPSPANLYLEILALNDGRPDSVYPAPHSLRADIADTYRSAIRRLYESGCRSIQLDDTACGLLCQDNYTKRLLQGGTDLMALHEDIIEVINRSVEGRPDDLCLSLYLSGGDSIVPEWEVMTYPDNIMPKILSRAAADKFYMPFDTGNDYQLEILRHVPQGKKVVVGLMDAHTPSDDDAESIRATVRKAGAYIPSTNLSVSPRTGFKLSSYAGRGLTYEDQWRKLRLLSRIAEDL